MGTYNDLNVYNRAYNLAIKVHKLSFRIPRELQYDLADQIRRASRSIPSNIAEGYSRKQSDADILRFLRISLGSNDEMLFNLKFMRDTEIFTRDELYEIYKDYVICGKQLTQLIKSFKQQENR